MKEAKEVKKTVKAETAKPAPVKTAPVKPTTKVTIDALSAAMDDLMTIFDWDDVPEMSSAKPADVVAYINAKQQGDDHFEVPDFEIENGKPTGLLVETVRTLINAGVKVPGKWAERLEALEPKTAEKAEKPAPKADPEETEYEEALEEARKEDAKPKKNLLSDTEPPKAPAKSAPAKPAEKAPAKKAPKGAAGGSKIKDLLAFCEPLFAKGIKESDLLAKLAEKFPETAAATFKTQIYRCRNEKYNQLPKLVVKSGDGVLKFAK